MDLERWFYKEYINIFQKSRICQILLGMLDVKYKRIIRQKFSSSLVVDLKKCFKRLVVESLFEVLGDARKYIVIEERLTELPRKSSKRLKRYN